MTIHVRDGGTWKQVSVPSVRDGGTWKNLSEGWVRDGGVWKKFYPSVAASLDTRTVSSTAFNPGTAQCYYRINTDGNVYGGTNLTNLLESWRDIGSNPDFEIYFDPISGTIPLGTNVTYNTWLDMSLTRTMTVGRTGTGSTIGVVDVSIRDAVGLGVLTTARITMIATVQEGEIPP
jgi:hypothetical protein